MVGFDSRGVTTANKGEQCPSAVRDFCGKILLALSFPCRERSGDIGCTFPPGIEMEGKVYRTIGRIPERQNSTNELSGVNKITGGW